MPAIDYTKLLLRELNTLNNQTYLNTDVKVDFSFQSGDLSKGRLSALSTGTIAAAGSTTFIYKRLDLQALLTASGVGQITVRRVTKISDLLPRHSGCYNCLRRKQQCHGESGQ